MDFRRISMSVAKSYPYFPEKERMGRRRSLEPRLPSVPRDIHAPVFRNSNPLRLQERFLLLESGAAGKGYRSPAADHPVPGEALNA
jgi:hypothetical protein